MLFGLYLILTERRLDQPENLGEMTASIYGGRYMLFMMDDCLDSHRRDVKCVADYKIHGHMTYVNATNVSNGDNVHAMGLDPIWKTSSNELLVFKSFMIKISVIFGIVQMTFGILLKG
ncbi:hypothetical protein PsorP6_000222 [Peronosclerospora sorghi]|uniref:Uncharacterized protein n=1 Tax=Peronosclerospora sorghi TaxID=230839 RepID=A0ACC0WUD9_9STRA|nr:hypothetical protein PsorP6_000222 [Peronosclerospora sorghi]